MVPVYLLLLPALACGKIVVYVDLTLNPPLIDVSGHSEIPITEKERLTFKLDDEHLKKSVAKYSGAAPTDVFVRNGLYNLYKTYDDWQEVNRTIKPTLVTKTDTKHSKPVCKDEPESLTKNTTVQSFWNNSTIPTNESTEYEIVYGSNRLKINSHWGKQIDEFQTNPVPGNFKKCILTVYLEYEATLSGDVAANYINKMDGSHFWKFDVNKVQIEGGFPTSMFYKENVTIEYYAK